MIVSPFVSLHEMRNLLQDWHHFIRGGFQLTDYPPELHHFLINYGRFHQQDDLRERTNFWRHYFGTSLERLRYFIERFSLVEADSSPQACGICLYDHIEDLGRNLYADMEAARGKLLAVIGAIMADVHECNILYLAHSAQANELDRSFADIKREIEAGYNPALVQVEVTLSNDIRVALAEPFLPPPVAVAHPSLWTHRQGQTASQPNGNGQTERTARPQFFVGWQLDQARLRLQNQASDEHRTGSSHVGYNATQTVNH
jgi:hypothetical protein